MKKIIFFCFLFILLNIYAYCQQLSKIELSDGSVVNGEIVSYLNGVYTINTPTFGVIKISSTKVAKIESLGNALPNSPRIPNLQNTNITGSQISTYGQTLMKNPENAAVIMKLANDTNLQELASDPQIQAAAKTGDIQSLLNNPKFMEIVNSPQMQEATKKIKQ